jgi:hypothetical protein
MNNLQNVIDDFARTVNNAYAVLREMGDDDIARAHGPEKWSTKQVMGHLIDSAANNHQRFVRLQEGTELSLPKYAQEHWVNSQDYQHEAWMDILELWRAYNKHLIHVVSRVPEKSLTNTCRVGDNEPATLQFLIEDYVDHMKNHLASIPSIRAR